PGAADGRHTGSLARGRAEVLELPERQAVLHHPEDEHGEEPHDQGELHRRGSVFTTEPRLRLPVPHPPSHLELFVGPSSPRLEPETRAAGEGRFETTAQQAVLVSMQVPTWLNCEL